jgi:hypothetical protein
MVAPAGFWRVDDGGGGEGCQEHHRDGGAHLGDWKGKRLTEDGPPQWWWSCRKAQWRQHGLEGDGCVWRVRRLHGALMELEEVVGADCGRGRQSPVRKPHDGLALVLRDSLMVDGGLSAAPIA